MRATPCGTWEYTTVPQARHCIQLVEGVCILLEIMCLPFKRSKIKPSSQITSSNVCLFFSLHQVHECAVPQIRISRITSHVNSLIWRIVASWMKVHGMAQPGCRNNPAHFPEFMKRSDQIGRGSRFPSPVILQFSHPPFMLN